MRGLGSRLRRFAALGLLSLGWLPGDASLASERPALPDARSQVVVSLADTSDGTVRLEGRFTVAASSATAWSVLTDYEHIPAFVSSMRSSRVKSRDDGCLLVEQESVGKALLFHRKVYVLLRVRETPRELIAFEDLSKASFDRYEGAWQLRPTPGGVEVTYRLTAKGGVTAPGFLLRGAYRKMVGELLEQVRTRIASVR